MLPAGVCAPSRSSGAGAGAGVEGTSPPWEGPVGGRRCTLNSSRSVPARGPAAETKQGSPDTSGGRGGGVRPGAALWGQREGAGGRARPGPARPLSLRVSTRRHPVYLHRGLRVRAGRVSSAGGSSEWGRGTRSEKWGRRSRRVPADLFGVRLQRERRRCSHPGFPARGARNSHSCLLEQRCYGLLLRQRPLVACLGDATFRTKLRAEPDTRPSGSLPVSPI